MSNKPSSAKYASLLYISLVTTLGLQFIRVLLPSFVQYLRDSLGMSSLTLAPIAVLIFALSFLASPFARLAGPRRALWIITGGIALLRVADQFSTIPSIDLVLSALGVLLFTWFIPIGLGIALNAGRGEAANYTLGLLIGVALDTSLHIAGGTLDLTWQTGWIPVLVIVLLAVLSIVFLSFYLKRAGHISTLDVSWPIGLALIAVGPWMLIELLIFQNVARAAAITGLWLPIAAVVVMLGNLVGIVLAISTLRVSSRTFTTALMYGGIFLLIMALVNTPLLIPVLQYIFGQTLAAILLTVLMIGLSQAHTKPGLNNLSIANGVGQLLFILFAFFYYVNYDLPLGLSNSILLFVAGFVVVVSAILAARGTSSEQGVEINFAPALLVLLFLAIPVILYFRNPAPTVVTPNPTNDQVRVMDYNLHNAFNTDGRMSIQELADNIEAGGADVVALQEVSRGWLINGSLDMLYWLSQRLGMPYISGPTADPQWGNAILSRYPIVEASLNPLPPDSLPLKRGFIQAKIDIGKDQLSVIATHLHHVEADSEIRQQQTPVLVQAWNQAPKTILMGDLNASPDSPEMQTLSSAGLINIAEQALPGDPAARYTYSSTNPERQVDYIWTSPDLGFADFSIPRSTASDHLPLVATIKLP